MQDFLIALHLVIVVLLIGVILIQRSEGGGLGLSQESNFLKSRSKGTALTRTTAYLSAAFFTTTVALTIASNPLITTSGPGDSIELPGFENKTNELGLPDIGEDLQLPDLNQFLEEDAPLEETPAPETESALAPRESNLETTDPATGSEPPATQGQ